VALEKYRAKRNFAVTPEPRGKAARARKHELAFVVQKHAASHLHYDFRLELDGVLLSWAVPKGPSFDPADKRLAMHVEDHPIEYGDFEGVIPPHQYGAGTVMLWDRGTWHPTGDPVAGYKKGHLKFTLDGEKLKGGWTLLRTQGSRYGGSSGKEAWLLIKERDAEARSGGPPIVESAPDSVTTGRSLDKIAAARSHVWQSSKSVAQNVKAGAIAGTPKRAAKRTPPSTKTSGAGTAKTPAAKRDVPPEGAKPAKLPATLSPMLTTLVSAAPPGDDWIHEIKYDGYRMVCRIDGKDVRIVSRNGKDWTAAFPRLAADLKRLPVKGAWIDGEVVVLDAEGRSSFQALQNALSDGDAAFQFFAFDLPYCDGLDLRAVPLVERKRLLRGIVGEGVGAVRVGPEVTGHGDEFFRQACSLSLEGAICKRAESPYRSGLRTREWLKVKCTRQQEMVIGGYTDPQGSRTGFGALMLGVYEGGKLRYAGKVGTGFNDKLLRDIHAQLRKRERDTPPFANPPRGYEARGAHWVEPDLVAEVAFTEWSSDGALRHPSFLGLRIDKKATEVVREKEAKLRKHGQAPAPRARARPARVAARDEAVRVAGIAISNPDKPYFPESSLSKIDVARYYEAIAPHLLPHIEGRPLSLVRCPDGWNGQCFYQKNADRAVHEAVDRVEVPEKSGTATYMAARSAAALVALVQWGVLEMHPWGSRKPRLDRPDRLIFDFDPDDGIPWADVVTAVKLMRTLLGELDLEGFLKTTGGKGLHVVLPIRATLGWDEAKAFTRAVADFMVRTFGDRFTATVSKERRKGKIFIDYLRNAEGATAIAPFAVRARAGAPVAMPIAWEDLERGDVRFDHFSVLNAREHLAKRRRDPWKDFFRTSQSITKAHRKRMGL
jgi:bifunctional non-homologous end joining protein LigD